MLELDTMFRRSEFLFVLVMLALHHLLNPLNNAQQVASRGRKVILQHLVHPFNGRACNRVIVAVLRGPGSCPLGACKVLVRLQVSAEFLLMAIIFKQIVPL
jgi:hypothetical protein